MTKIEITDFLCEMVAWMLYWLSCIKLAPRPSYSHCIANITTCGYKLDENGFFKYPLYKLASKINTATRRWKGKIEGDKLLLKDVLMSLQSISPVTDSIPRSKLVITGPTTLLRKLEIINCESGVSLFTTEKF